MKIASALAVVAILAGAPVAAQASDFSYSYAEAGWASVDIDGLSQSFDGFMLRGSVGIAESFFLSADYLDVGSGGVDYQQYSLGFGGHYPLSDMVDLTGRVAWVKAEVSGFGFSTDDDGYSVGAGLRGRLGDQFELEGTVAYVDLGGDGGDDVVATIAGRYFFNDMFAVGAEYNAYEDAKIWGVGFRVNFGN